MKNWLLALVVILPLFTACSQSTADQTAMTSTTPLTPTMKHLGWNPDAGVIPSLTVGSKTAVSSGETTALKLIDEKKETHWQSGSPYPQNFLMREDQNILLNYFSKTKNYNASKIDNPNFATDGNTQSSTTNISPVNGEAFLEIKFPIPQDLHAIALRAGNVGNDIEFFVLQNGKTLPVGFYKKSNDFNMLRLSVIAKKVSSIILKSKSAFSIFEIAALESAPKEWAMVDLGKVQSVGWVSTRHWAGKGSAVASALYISTDAKKWNKVKDLNPEALQTVTTIIDPPLPARYIKVEHALAEKDWGSVFIWEIDAYDENGPFGKIPDAKPNPNSFSNLLGVNGIWGWGYEKYSDLQPKGKGSELFEQISSHARNYHFLNWDVNDPDNVPDYFTMAAGKGTEVNWWLDWDREYKVWTKNNMKLQTSIQFRDIPKAQWDNPYQAGYQFAYKFAQHFGPTSGNGLVETMEAGNEPWYYDADFYKEILRGMVEGAKKGDPNIKVIPCALQSTFPANEYEGQFKNYMGARVTPEIKDKIDALNVHLVPWTYDDKGRQISVHPEHPYCGMRGIFNDVRFRDQNLPGMPIYVSEWGWDSDGGTEECIHGECVSERAQALYAVRGAMMLARVGVDRATWYFFANENKESSLFTRSGLVSSLTTDFQIKQAFVAWKAMVYHLGDKHFQGVLKEDDDAWVYIVGDKNGKATHIVAWKPIEAENKTSTKISISTKHQPMEAHALEGKNEKGEKVATPIWKNGKMEIQVSAVPVVIQIK